MTIDEMMTEVTYSIWPERPKGGQQVGSGPQGVKAIHPIGIEICCQTERSQFKNKQHVDLLMRNALERFVS